MLPDAYVFGRAYRDRFSELSDYQLVKDAKL